MNPALFVSVKGVTKKAPRFYRGARNTSWSGINGGRDRDRPNHGRCASGGRLHPTNDGALSSSVPAPHAIHAVHGPPACCTSHDVRWLHAACDLPWRCVAGTYRRHSGERMRAAPRRKPALLQARQWRAPPCRIPFSPECKASCSPPSIFRPDWNGVRSRRIKHGGGQNVAMPGPHYKYIQISLLAMV